MDSAMSLLEIRHYIERAFLPDKCVCDSPDGLNLTLSITRHEDPSLSVTMTGIRIADAQSSRAVNDLVAEGRYLLSTANQKTLSQSAR